MNLQSQLQPNKLDVCNQEMWRVSAPGGCEECARPPSQGASPAKEPHGTATLIPAVLGEPYVEHQVCEHAVRCFVVSGLAADAAADGLDVYRDDWSLGVSSD